MCRLYGQISTTPALARDLLVDAERSLLRQSDFDPRNRQEDGWGLAYFGASGARVEKSAAPVFDERGRFAALASRLRSRVLLGHIRAASNPRKLQAKRLVSRKNTQPFTDGRLAFAHNGTLNIPDAVAETLGPTRSRILGLNDSEVFFWLFVTRLDRLGDIPRAIEDCVRGIWAVWRKLKSRGTGRRPYTGLNALVSDGRSLHALCHYRTEPGDGSIFNPAQPWGTMSLARRGERVVIASEDLDAGPWERLKDPEIVSVTPRGGRLEIRRRRFDPS